MNPLKQCLAKLTAEYESEMSRRHSGAEDPWYPAFHLAPPVGWLNDPNGLCYFRGEYHVFFQYSPFDTSGGLKLWGHYAGKNLLSLAYVGVALYPDEPYDCHGVYSGCALEEDGKLYLFYTGNVKREGDFDYVTSGREANTVAAVSRDGRHFSKKKLLLRNADYPEDISCHVRDPRVFRENGRYYMVLGARTTKDRGAVLVYEASDLFSWNYVNRITAKEPFGYMWECPDLFCLDGIRYLCVSVQDCPTEAEEYRNLYRCGYFTVTGDFTAAGDFTKGGDAAVKGGSPESCTLDEFAPLDWGFDFYAPQSFEAPDGRRLLIGWMGMPDSESCHLNPSAKYGWNQILTVPRELFTQNGRLCQRPIKELEEKWTSVRTYLASDDREEFTAGEPEVFQLDILTKNCDLVIMLEDLSLSFCRENGVFEMKFTGGSGCGRTVRRAAIGCLREVTVLVDRSCAEVFLNGGETVFSTRFYPDGNTRTLKITGKTLNKTIRQ